MRTAVAEQGQLTSALTFTGDVRAVSQVNVMPKATGRIERLRVDVGSRVRVGDTIAEMDSATLRAQVSQAEANLASATAKFNGMEAGGRPEQVGQAAANLDSARQKLASMEAGGRPEQVGQAAASLASARARLNGLLQGGREEQVAQARANLDNAREKLADMEDGNRGEQIAQAEAGLRTAWARKDQVNKGPTEADREAAVRAVETAKANLITARARLETLRIGPTLADVAAAVATADTAAATLRAAEARLAEVRAGPRAADILAAEAAVESARAALAAAEDRRDVARDTNNTAVLGPAGVTSAGQAERAVAAAQANLDAVVARLNLLRAGPLAADLQAAQSAVDSARATMAAATARVEQLRRGATPQEIQQAEAAVWSAEAGVATAAARQRQIEYGPSAEDIAAAEAAVTQAEQTLSLAKSPFTEHDLAQARNAVTALEEQLKLAERPYSPSEIEQSRAAVAGAEQAYGLSARPFSEYDIAQSRNAVSVAEDQVRLAESPFTVHDLEAGQAAVLQAQAALDISQVTLSEAVITSPLDGVVSERLVSPGALVGPTSPIATIVSSDVEVAVGLEESQIGSIVEGQRAEINVSAFPGVVFPARVALVGPVADPRSRTFQVRVRPEPQDPRLRPGMFADVRIVTGERANAVTIPREAVVTRNGRPTVAVVVNDIVEIRQVELGLSSGGSVEVVSGVNAAEEVVVAGQNEVKAGDRIRRQ